MNKANVIITLKKTLLVIIGSFVLSFGTAIFFIPNEIVSGGMPGVAVVFNYLLGWDEELVIAIATWTLFFIGFLVLGKKFALQTLCSTIVYPLGVFLFGLLYDNFDFLHLQSSVILGLNTVNVNDLLAALFGGIFTGAGVALTFLGGGSTGGVDIPALILQKYAKVKVALGSLIMDVLVIISGLISIKRLDLALVGIVGAVVTAFVMDKVLMGNKSSYVAYIISDKYEEINSYILKEMDRGTTLLDVIGGYSGNDIKMITVCFDYREYTLLQNGLESIDEDAFIFIVKAHKVKGNGFKGTNELFDKTKLDEWMEKRRQKGETHEE